MKQQITTLLAGLFDIKNEDVTESLTMANTDGWDSLKHMELIASIEGTFDIELTFEEIVAMQTFNDIKTILEEKGVD